MDQVEKIISIENDFGEKIFIKRIDKKILIHHTDCSDDYVSFDFFISEYIVSAEEFMMISMCIFKLVNNK